MDVNFFYRLAHLSVNCLVQFIVELFSFADYAHCMYLCFVMIVTQPPLNRD